MLWTSREAVAVCSILLAKVDSNGRVVVERCLYFCSHLRGTHNAEDTLVRASQTPTQQGEQKTTNKETKNEEWRKFPPYYSLAIVSAGTAQLREGVCRVLQPLDEEKNKKKKQEEEVRKKKYDKKQE